MVVVGVSLCWVGVTYSQERMPGVFKNATLCKCVSHFVLRDRRTDRERDNDREEKITRLD